MTFEVSRSSKLIRYAYFDPYGIFEVHIPYSTSTCQLFWRCVLFTPMTLLAAIVISPILGFGWIVFKGTILLSNIKDAHFPKKYKPYKQSLIKAAWNGFKDKTCPIVKIVDDTNPYRDI